MTNLKPTLLEMLNDAGVNYKVSSKGKILVKSKGMDFVGRKYGLYCKPRGRPLSERFRIESEEQLKEYFPRFLAQQPQTTGSTTESTTESSTATTESSNDSEVANSTEDDTDDTDDDDVDPVAWSTEDEEDAEDLIKQQMDQLKQQQVQLAKKLEERKKVRARICSNAMEKVVKEEVSVAVNKILYRAKEYITV